MDIERKPAADVEALRGQILADPSIVLDDMDLMRALIAASGAKGGRNVVDLRGALVERLEHRLGRLEETHRSVIAAAYENLAGVNQIHRAVLAMLECGKFSDLLRVLEDEVPVMLGVDALRVCLEAASAGDEPMPASAVLVTLPPGAVAAYLDLDRPSAHRQVVLRRTVPGARAVFGDDAERVKSEAIIQLDLGVPQPALIAFGAEDPARFSPDQAGDLLAFFGGVVERTMRRWLS